MLFRVFNSSMITVAHNLASRRSSWTTSYTAERGVLGGRPKVERYVRLMVPSMAWQTSSGGILTTDGYIMRLVTSPLMTALAT